jgi:uncharacterized membrane protein YheB (UPF0754 family)
MTTFWTTWIALPLIGSAIGWFTNRLAVRMIFRPIRPRRFLGIRVQGLIGRRQKELARSIGEVVGGHLVQHDDIVRGLGSLDLETLLGDVLDRGLGPKIQELRGLPLIGGFLTDDRIADLRKSLVTGILAEREALIEAIEKAVEAGLDVPQMVRQKVEAFPVERVEELILHVASKELRSIEVLGGVLGLLIGFAQAALIHFL